MGKLLIICVDRLCLWFAKKRIGNLVKAAMKTHKNTLNTHGRKTTRFLCRSRERARANVEVMSAVAKTTPFCAAAKDRIRVEVEHGAAAFSRVFGAVAGSRFRVEVGLRRVAGQRGNCCAVAAT